MSFIASDLKCLRIFEQKHGIVEAFAWGSETDFGVAADLAAARIWFAVRLVGCAVTTTLAGLETDAATAA